MILFMEIYFGLSSLIEKYISTKRASSRELALLVENNIFILRLHRILNNTDDSCD